LQSRQTYDILASSTLLGIDLWPNAESEICVELDLKDCKFVLIHNYKLLKIKLSCLWSGYPPTHIAETDRAYERTDYDVQ